MVTSNEPQSIDSRFMKTLVMCHILQRQARRKVSKYDAIIKQHLRVFQWQQKIRKQAGLQLQMEESCSKNREESPDKNLQVYDYESSSSNIDQSHSNHTDPGIVRRNLWLMIARTEIKQEYRRRKSQKEQKLAKSKAIQKMFSDCPHLQKLKSHNDKRGKEIKS